MPHSDLLILAEKNCTRKTHGSGRVGRIEHKSLLFLRLLSASSCRMWRLPAHHAAESAGHTPYICAEVLPYDTYSEKVSRLSCHKPSDCIGRSSGREPPKTGLPMPWLS
jgi:hypothetical protein